MEQINDETNNQEESLLVAKENLKDLCESNGIIDMKECQYIEELDMFMGCITNLNSTQNFPNLKSLCIMKQINLNEIIGLNKCYELNKLWLTEIELLNKITGLERLPKLKELYICKNPKIISLSHGLSTLSNLTTLWLNENGLTDLKGLECLVNLKILWACKYSTQYIYYINCILAIVIYYCYLLLFII